MWLVRVCIDIVIGQRHVKQRLYRHFGRKYDKIARKVDDCYLTRSSAITEERATHCISWNLVNCCAGVRTAFSRYMALKVTQRHRDCWYSMGHIPHFIVVCCIKFNDSRLASFPIYYCTIYIYSSVHDWLWLTEDLHFRKYSCMFLRLAVLIQYRHVTDRHTQTDRHTDTRRRLIRQYPRISTSRE